MNPTGVIKVLAAITGVILGKMILDATDKKDAEKAEKATVTPVVVNVNKRYVTRKPKSSRKAKKDDSQNLEVVKPEVVAPPVEQEPAPITVSDGNNEEQQEV